LPKNNCGYLEENYAKDFSYCIGFPSLNLVSTEDNLTSKTKSYYISSIWCWKSHSRESTSSELDRVSQ